MKLSKLAVERLNNYMLKEFDHKFNYYGQNEIGLAYTTHPDDDHEERPIETTLIVDKLQIVTSLNNEIIDIEEYESISELEKAIEFLCFDALIYPAIA